MSIIVWIIIGGLAGWIANMIMKTDGSLVKNIVTGDQEPADAKSWEPDTLVARQTVEIQGVEAA